MRNKAGIRAFTSTTVIRTSPLLMVALTGCASAGTRSAQSEDPLRGYDPAAASTAPAPAFEQIYRSMGLVASGPPLWFVANAATFATSSPDTSLVIVALSMPNRGLTFRHDEGGYHADYEVALTLARDTTSVVTTRDSETVRISGFRETTRTDETIVYQRAIRIPPGEYRATFAVTDVLGRHELERTVTLAVRRFTGQSFARPMVVYSATPRTRLDSIPHLVPRPRASAVFGVDDSVAVYVESYAKKPLTVTLANDSGSTVWRAPAPITTHGDLASGVVQVPLLSADMGVLTISLSSAGSPDTTRTGIYLGFGPDLPVLSYDQMVDYLSLFASPHLLRTLRSAPASERGTRWREFLRATDPRPNTPQNEALQAYFARISEANAQFTRDFPRGWRSDRGSVYVALGEPSNIYDGYTSAYALGDFSAGVTRGQRVHVLVWEYQNQQANISFYDPTGTDMWRFTPMGAQTFRTLLGRTLAQ